MKHLYSLQQGIYSLKVVIMCHTASHILPDILLRVQLWRVGRQPLDLNLVPMPLQQLVDTFCLMCFVIVDEQNNLAFWVRRQIIGPRNGGEQSPETHIVATAMNHMHASTGDRINGAPIPPLCCSHTWCEDGPLLANGCPTTSDGWKRTYLGRISEEENQVWSGLRFQFSDVFFSLQRGQNLAYV